MIPPPPNSTLFPYTTLFRSEITIASAPHATARWASSTLCTPLMTIGPCHASRIQGISSHVTAEACSRSEEHTSELQSLTNLVCRLLLEKKKKQYNNAVIQST